MRGWPDRPARRAHSHLSRRSPTFKPPRRQQRSWEPLRQDDVEVRIAGLQHIEQRSQLALIAVGGQPAGASRVPCHRPPGRRAPALGLRRTAAAQDPDQWVEADDEDEREEDRCDDACKLLRRRTETRSPVMLSTTIRPRGSGQRASAPNPMWSQLKSPGAGTRCDPPGMGDAIQGGRCRNCRRGPSPIRRCRVRGCGARSGRPLPRSARTLTARGDLVESVRYRGGGVALLMRVSELSGR